MTLASLIIPSRGGAARLPVLLEALSRQDVDTWEAIIVLDGDIDDSAGAIERHRRNLPVRTIVFPENRGRVAALNAGFAAAEGDVLVRCDDDLEPAPSYVAHHLRAHDGPPVGVIGIYKNVLHDTPYSRVYGRQADGEFRERAYSAAPEDRWLFWAGNCSVTREVWEQVGPYDVRYRAYGWEDVDYGLRLAKAGYPIVIDRSLETTHHAAAVTTESRVRRAYRSGQARRLFDSIHEQSDTALVRPANDSPWNILKNVATPLLNYERARRLARGIDTWVLPRAPRPVGTKCIAFLVESASLAGYADTKDAANDF